MGPLLYRDRPGKKDGGSEKGARHEIAVDQGPSGGLLHRGAGQHDAPPGAYSRSVSEVEMVISAYRKAVGKKRGTLRPGWTAGSRDTQACAETLPAEKQGGAYTAEGINPVNYASAVEFGRRTRGGKGRVDRQYFPTLSGQNLWSPA